MSDRATYPPPSSMPSTRADSSQPQASPPSDESASQDSSSRPTSQAPTASEPLNPDATPQRIGRYRVARVLGRGGFGTVFLAHDDELRRLVAIKVPHRNLIFGSVDRDAYLAEARIVANLDHPNIVPVHDIGVTDDSTFYIVSKYIDGANLATKISQSRLPLAEAVELVAAVGEAVHYAHKQGVVHRDIKPGNIVLDSNGQPFVADFGIALREHDAEKVDRYAGTPPYMSPEQARGEGHRLDGRSDVFSLGVVLYELLTGERPFQGDSKQEVLEKIASLEPRPLRQIDDKIPLQLERVCLKALAKRVCDRYSTAKDFADDLRQFCRESPPTEAQAPRANASAPPASDSSAAPVVPKGLRAFDADDADFFVDLLPGPRDRRGLPEAIRFWKSRIERTEPEESFAVGLLYGPSGCGKSSLMKAGLLPRLAPHVKILYLEATSDLEPRLLYQLGKLCPSVKGMSSLPQALAAIRRGQADTGGDKILIVLDQFEQWLHAHGGGGGVESELVRGLRQCDGGRLQCLVMVRDDFWMMSTRFMRDLDVRVIDGENAAAVDLFTPLHARKVLAAFGRAYGALPARGQELAPAQADFLDQAVAALTTGGWIMPVRLALFADMVKGRPWTSTVLREVGGAVGIGVAFLEESFTSATAPPEHRRHQKAVQAVLGSLLPPPGTDLKGCMRGRGELLEVSGYRHAPEDFDALIKILVGTTRLLTPVAGRDAGVDDGSGARQSMDGSGGQCYQLTHDYLVPPIREWLTRRQKETRRGQAELRLVERGALWQAKQEQRQLPSLSEWLAIRFLTASSTWTDSQRQMMRAAARKHLWGAARLVAAVLLLTGAGLFVRAALGEERAATRAHALVGRLLDAKVAQVPAIVNELADSRAWADPVLRQVVANPSSPPDHQLHARLALLPVDVGQLEYLQKSLLDADPNQFAVLRDALLPYRTSLVDGFWQMVENDRERIQRRFRAAAALAAYDPSNQRWDKAIPWVADQLAIQPSLVLQRWVDALRPIKHRLTPALAALIQIRMRSPATDAAVANAAEIIGDYAAEQPDVLAEALADAPPTSFPTLFNRLQVHKDGAVASLTAVLDQKSGNGGATPNELAGRRANVAIALMRLGAGERLWPLLKASPDPRVRSFAIDRFAALECDPALLVRRLEVETDPSIRAALWLGLREFNQTALPQEQRAELITKVLKLYRDDPSAAVHAAAQSLLTKWAVPDLALPPTRRLMNGIPANDKEWYVISAGQTMIRIERPGIFPIGSPPDERGRNPKDEKRHQAEIDYSYDIGMTEVTIDQFRRFLESRNGQDERLRPPGDMPITKVTWYEAAAYCNWLSELEGIPREEWCYEPNAKTGFAEGMTIVADFRRRTGYRLPTEAEWEYACRGGAATSRCYGDADELLPRYAWYAANAQEFRKPVALLLPNAFGLFDMHGNASEWCQNLVLLYDDPRLTKIGAETVKNEDFRASRGGSILNYAQIIRSAKRFSDRPTFSEAGGLRIARSHP